MRLRLKPSHLRDDTPLRTSLILDSLATPRLVTFVEDRYGIEVEALEAGVQNFDRIDSIASFVAGKAGATRWRGVSPARNPAGSRAGRPGPVPPCGGSSSRLP